METVRVRLRQWRKEQGYTLKEVASAVGKQLGREISASSMSNFESRSDPSTQVVQALAVAFPELSLRWLLTGEKPAYGLIEEQPEGYYIPEAVDREVKRIADEIVSLPFKYPDHFLTLGEMTEAEKHTYLLSMYAGIRQVARGICRDSRRFGPPKGTKGSKRVFKEAGTHP